MKPAAAPARNAASKRRDLPQRTRELALIHIARHQLALDEAAYRDMLFALTGKRSAAELGDAGRARVLEHMVASGAHIQWSRRRAVRLADDRAPLVRKVRALLIALGNFSDTYGDAIAKRMFGVERFEWCDPQQLRSIVAALEVRQAKLRAGAR